MKFLEDKKEKLLKKLRLWQNKFFVLLVCIFAFGCGYYVYQSVHIEYPTKDRPIVSYFEESGHDLKYIYCSLLQKAQKSIFISSFGISDPDILRILKEKRLAGIKIINHNSRQQKSLRKKVHGLYHRKILIIDNEELYIGSANCSIPSLCFHGNQILGFYNQALIKAIKENKSHISDELFFYLLPGSSKQALSHLLSLLKNAQAKITLTMLTLTHPDIIDELINAHQRGVSVKIYLDHGSSKGSCKKYIQKLIQYNIPINTRQKYGLLHHKSAIIDDIYVFGSTNFSKNGFGRNEETLIVMPCIPSQLKKDLKTFIKNTDYYSVAI
ncbi:MAG: Cardiolipin synthase A [Chlamydiia bacterium]|nr:Cardiolipin synthase A [Chlamydiia bacterium]